MIQGYYKEPKAGSIQLEEIMRTGMGSVSGTLSLFFICDIFYFADKLSLPFTHITENGHSAPKSKWYVSAK